MKKLELEKIIESTIKRVLKESGKNDVVFVENVTSNWFQLWISYSPGSGITYQLKDLKHFLSDNPAHKEWDHMTAELVDWSNNHTPTIKRNQHKLYEIPVYNLNGYRILNPNSYQTGYKDLEIFGGEIKPSKKIYMVISTETSGFHVINFFINKNEAISWTKN